MKNKILPGMYIQVRNLNKISGSWHIRVVTRVDGHMIWNSTLLSDRLLINDITEVISVITEDEAKQIVMLHLLENE